MNETDDSGTSSGRSTSEESESERRGGTSAGEQEPEPEPEPEPAQWKTVATLEGNTNKAGPDFSLNGCDTRMKYDVMGGDFIVVGFYLLDSGTNLMEDGGFPVASPTEAGPGETQIRTDEGEYFISVNSANASWTVQVQEKC